MVRRHSHRRFVPLEEGGRPLCTLQVLHMAQQFRPTVVWHSVVNSLLDLLEHSPRAKVTHGCAIGGAEGRQMRSKVARCHPTPRHVYSLGCATCCSRIVTSCPFAHQTRGSAWVQGQRKGGLIFARGRVGC